jgi:hypothetical protein
VDHLLWSGVYHEVNFVKVLDKCNRMAANCTLDFFLKTHQFRLCQSLYAYVACIEILKLEGLRRDLDLVLNEKLQRVLGIDMWLSHEANACQYKRFVLRFNQYS